MRIGIQLSLQAHDDFDDRAMLRQELALALMAEGLGFDAIWVPEHHFTGYSMSPDNIMLLGYLAGQTSHIALGTGAVILPWNDPLRVVERIILLDHLSDGRVIFGLGRGLGRTEFEGLRIDMSESRARFDEAAQIIIDGLASGFVEAETSMFSQPKVEVRPRSRGTFAGRTYMVTMSPESFDVAADLGLGSMMFSEVPWEKRAPQLAAYRERYESLGHPNPPLPVSTCDYVVCHEDEARAAEMADTYLGRYFRSVLEHYEMLESHFEKAGAAYARYATDAEMLRRVGAERATRSYIDSNLAGTPEQILDQLEARRALIGDFDFNAVFSYASMPYDQARDSMTLFANEVVPEWRRRRADDDAVARV